MHYLGVDNGRRGREGPFLGNQLTYSFFHPFIHTDRFQNFLGTKKIILQRTLPSKKLPSAGQDSRKFADWYDWNNAHCGFFPYIQKYYDTTVYLAFFCCYISNERHWEAVQPLFSLGNRTTPFFIGNCNKN